MLLLEGVGALDDSLDGLPPVLVGAVGAATGVGSSVDDLTETVESEWGVDGLVLLDEGIVQFKAKFAVHSFRCCK